jgi:transcriptional regulator with XRE-family HTH domain
MGSNDIIGGGDYPAEMKQRLAARLRLLRKQKGYSNYEQFAYEHNFSRSQYGRYEKGEDLRFSTIIRLAQAFGMSLKEFFAEGFE